MNIMHRFYLEMRFNKDHVMEHFDLEMKLRRKL